MRRRSARVAVALVILAAGVWLGLSAPALSGGTLVGLALIAYGGDRLIVATIPGRLIVTVDEACELLAGESRRG